MMRWLVMVVVISTAGCGNSAPRQVRIVPVMPQGSSSCPADTRSYSIRCVDALVVTLVGADGQRFKSQCTPITSPYDSLQALVSSTTVVEVLQDMKARAEAQLELRAYHSVPDHDPCEASSGGEESLVFWGQYLLFWGMSAVTDFTDSSVSEVAVAIDCRPQCDCNGLEKGTCLSEMLPGTGVCAPPEGRPCRKQCETDEKCYAGLLSCEVATCEDNPNPTAKCCTPVTEQICAKCAHDPDCESGICAHNITADELLCTSPCPPLPDVTLCPTGMSCKLLDNVLYERAH